MRGIHSILAACDASAPDEDGVAPRIVPERELVACRTGEASLEGREAELTQRETDLVHREHRLEAALDALSDGLWEWNLETGEVYFSPRYYSMLGYGPGELPPAYETWRALVHPDDLPNAEAVIWRHLDEGVPFFLEARLRSKAGQWRWVYSRGKVVEWDGQGRARRLVGSHTDITELKLADMKRKASEARFQGIHDMAAVGIIQADLAGRVLTINPHGTLLFGRPAEQIVGRSLFEIVHPDDLAAVMQTVATLAHGLSDTGRSERRFICADGRVVWVEMYTTAVRSEDDRDTVLLVVAVDVTERCDAEAALRASEEKYRALFESAADAVFVHDLDGRLLAVNDLACRTLGYTRTELVVLGVQGIEAPEQAANASANVLRVRRDGEATFETEHVRKDGTRLPVWIKSRLVTYDGRPAVLSVVRDITERRALEAELRRLATVDSLTGLANRRHFMELVESEAARARRYRRPLSLLVIDADHFKRINDTHGHPAGDEVLKAFAEVGRATLRRTDTLGRLGGEEFAVLLPETDLDGAQLLAERLRTRLARHTVRYDNRSIVFTISVGGATWSPDDGAVEPLFKRADDALYEAKRTGRNRVVMRSCGEGRHRSVTRLAAVRSDDDE